MGETVIFFREDTFYPITLSGLKDARIEAAEHAELNPGTLRIERIDGEVIWPEGNMQ